TDTFDEADTFSETENVDEQNGFNHGTSFDNKDRLDSKDSLDETNPFENDELDSEDQILADEDGFGFEESDSDESELFDDISQAVAVDDTSFDVVSDDEFGAPFPDFEQSDEVSNSVEAESDSFVRDGKEETFSEPERETRNADAFSSDEDFLSEDDSDDGFLTDEDFLSVDDPDDGFLSDDDFSTEDDSGDAFLTEDNAPVRDEGAGEEASGFANNQVFESSDALAAAAVGTASVAAAVGVASGLAARKEVKKEAEESHRKDKQDNVKSNKTEKGKPSQAKSAEGRSPSVFKASLISSFVTSALFIGGGYFAYDFVLKDTLATKDDVDDQVNRLQSSLGKSTEKEIKVIQDGYVTKAQFETMIGDLRQVIDDVESISGDKASDIAGSLREVKGLMATATQRLDALENQDLVLRSDMQTAIKQISTRSVEDNAARNGIVVALKKLESLEGKFDKEIEKILKESKADNGDISVKINELKVELLKEIDEVYSQADKARRMNEELYNKYSELSKSIDSNALPERKERTIANALGIDVAKGASQPVYNLSGIVNGRVFIDMDDDPKKQKIRYYNVGDYIDGYGKITSVSKESKEVMTESGKVKFRH
ncbi:hypothetical protein, partial [Photobacterium galatheae]